MLFSAFWSIIYAENNGTTGGKHDPDKKFHFDRAVDNDFHYCNSCGSSAAGVEQGQNAGEKFGLHQQPEAAGAGISDVLHGQRGFPASGLKRFRDQFHGSVLAETADGGISERYEQQGVPSGDVCDQPAVSVSLHERGLRS